MPFKGGKMEVWFARNANMDHEATQKALDEFQLALATAIINLGNLGCDPASMGYILSTLAEGVTVEGYATVAEVFHSDPHGQEYAGRLPALNPEFSKLGGHGRIPRPAGFGDDILAELGLRPRHAHEVN